MSLGMSTNTHQYTKTSSNGNGPEDGVSLTPEGVHVPVEDLEPAENPDTGKRFVDSAPDGRPRCGGELDPSAYASWTCWNCRDRVRVVDQGGDER